MEDLEPNVKTDRCVLYVDDVGVASHTVSELIENLDHEFQQIKKAGVKLSRAKCQFGKQLNEFLGQTISTGGIAPIEERITKF